LLSGSFISRSALQNVYVVLFDKESPGNFC